MPNYFIQAQTGHFNPMSFDEMVKPLQMYKEYYEQNEEKLTELQAQAKLWEDIANSELDSEYADKYNQYAQSLYDAANKMSNGMSYNLRNQIRDLRGQSAMMKQIENAYTLRAKDIDAYNELMLKDPSRIGATNPRNIKLNEYFGGPVQMNYGVSGDRLNLLGASQSYNMNDTSVLDTEINIVDQMQMNGYSMDEIMNFLEQNDSALYKMAENIMAGDNMPFRKGTSEYNQALIQTVNGIASGINKRKAELAALAAKGKSSGSGSNEADIFGGYNQSIGGNIGIQNKIEIDDKTASGKLLNSIRKGDNTNYYEGQDGELLSSKIAQLQSELNQDPTDVSKKVDLEKEKQRLKELSDELLNNGVPGRNDYERYYNFVNFYTNANQMNNEYVLPTGNTTEIEKLNKLYKEKYANSIKSLKYYDEDGDIQEIDSDSNKKEKDKIIKDGSIRFTTQGIAIQYDGKYYFINSDDNKSNEFDRNIQALNSSLLTINGQNDLYNNAKESQGGYKIGVSDIRCTVDGDNFVFLRDTGNGVQVLGSVKRYDAHGAMEMLLRLTYSTAAYDLLNIK